MFARKKGNRTDIGGGRRATEKQINTRMLEEGGM
jgi:hypothetical protein